MLIRIMMMVLLSGCNTISGTFKGMGEGLVEDFSFGEDEMVDEEPIHEPHCQVTASQSMKYPPVVMTYDEKKMQREIGKLRAKIMKKFAGLPMFWFDFEYDVNTQQDGMVIMAVTSCLKDDYHKIFLENRDKLYKILEDGA